MLIDFKFQNFRLFNDMQTFSMVKSKGDENTNNAFIIDEKKDFGLLKSTAIYGPNAGGKSNFFKAILTMKNIIIGSFQYGDNLPLVPFKLNSESKVQPSEFEITIIANNIRYQYGFSADSEQIYDEWLFAFPKGHAQKWFERAWDKENKDHVWRFSNFLHGSKQIWRDSKRKNALFLSTAVLLNSEQLKPLFDWFKNILQMCDSSGFGSFFTKELCLNEGKKSVLKFLKAADLNISDIKAKREDLSNPKLPSYFPDTIRSALSEEFKGKTKITLETVHTDSTGHDVTFNYDDESDGTQKLFNFSGPIIDVLSNGLVLFIDELNANLHPKLVEFIVKLFHSKETNPKNAQLIFTTHETSILTQEIFRRDQIWFCERDDTQASKLYSLLEFSPKKEKENLELGYLSGRYEAIPFIAPLSLEDD